MPSFRKKVAGFIRQLSNPGHNGDVEDNGFRSRDPPQTPPPPPTASFIHRYLNGDLTRDHPPIYHGRSFKDLPVFRVSVLSQRVRASYTGPSGGLTRVNNKRRPRREVDVRHPDLAFVDTRRVARTASLAQQEDLDEFLDVRPKDTSCLPDPGKLSTATQLRRHKSDCCERFRHRERRLDAGQPTAWPGKQDLATSAPLTVPNPPPNEEVSHSWGGIEYKDTSWKRDSYVEEEPEEEDLHQDSDGALDDGYLTGNEDDFRDAIESRIAGIRNWNRPHEKGYGAATSLYERNPVTGHHTGDPIADAFALCLRDNSALLVLADGVNWGEKSCLAARCAVHGAVDYINRSVFEPGPVSIYTTKDIFLILLQSLFAAHNLILQEEGTLTTLCVAFVCPLLIGEPRRHVVCACNVGDSFAYVYSKKHGVREITQGSHDIHTMRDMRDALGALGPVDGLNPELNNLTCSLTEVEEGDIVFLTSDGITDNFDPVIGKFAIIREDNNNVGAATGKNPTSNGPAKQVWSNNAKNTETKRRTEKQPSGYYGSLGRKLKTAGATNSSGHHRHSSAPQRPTSAPSGGGRRGHQRQLSSSSTPTRPPASPPSPPPLAFDPALPVVEAHQRHALTLLRMEDLLNNGASVDGDSEFCSTAHQLCDSLIDFAARLTVAKRRLLEDPDLYAGLEGDYVSASEQRQRRRKLGDKLAMVPGKLDHASVVAYQVGEWRSLSVSSASPASTLGSCCHDSEATDSLKEVDDSADTVTITSQRTVISNESEPKVITTSDVCNNNDDGYRTLPDVHNNNIRRMESTL